LIFNSTEFATYLPGLPWLLLATFGLYGGGIVFNDVFDANLDAKERPERAIPSGRVSKTQATILGITLFAIALIASFQVNIVSGCIAIFIMVFALIYDFKAKHHVVYGPLCMGLCRAGNILLGSSFAPEIMPSISFIGLFPILYIAAITLISKGEVTGGDKKLGLIAFGMVTVVIISIPIMSILPIFNFLHALPFLLLFGWMVVPAFFKAAKTAISSDIRNAVKRGVISLIILNSVLAAGFAGLIPGLLVLLLFPISWLLAKLFAVT